MAVPKDSEVQLFSLLGEKAIEYLGRGLSLAEMWVLRKNCLAAFHARKERQS